MSELKGLSDAATPGQWHLDMFPFRDVETGKEEPPQCEGICTHNDDDGLAEEVATCSEPDARFVVALVNAYRSGRLKEIEAKSPTSTAAPFIGLPLGDGKWV